MRGVYLLKESLTRCLLSASSMIFVRIYFISSLFSFVHGSAIRSIHPARDSSSLICGIVAVRWLDLPTSLFSSYKDMQSSVAYVMVWLMSALRGMILYEPSANIACTIYKMSGLLVCRTLSPKLYLFFGFLPIFCLFHSSLIIYE